MFGALLWFLLGLDVGQSPRGPKKPHVQAARVTLGLICVVAVVGAITYLVLTFS